MPARKHIGLEIGDTEFRLAELHADNEGPVLAHARLLQTEYNYGSPLLHEAPFNRTIAKAFIRDLTTLFQSVAVQASVIAVAMPAASLLVHTIPLEPRLSGTEKREQLEWECRSLFGFESDIAIDVRSSIIGGTEDAEYHLVAAMPAQTNEFLRSVFQQLSFRLKDLDVNHFTVENCILDLIKNSRARTYAVIGLYDDFCSIGIYKKGDYQGYRQTIISPTEGYFAQVLRLLQGLLADEPLVELEAVFCFGNVATETLLQSLRSLLEIPVTRYAPLSRMPYISRDVEKTVSSYGPHVFDIPVSVSLLGLR